MTPRPYPASTESSRRDGSPGGAAASCHRPRWALFLTACLLLALACEKQAPDRSDLNASGTTATTTRPAASTENARPDPLEVARERLRRAESGLDAFCSQRGCPGATLGFVLPDGGSGGVAVGVSRKGAPRKMKPTDRMFSGSIGKTFVAAVVLELVEEGRLDLDAKVGRWFAGNAWFQRLPNAKDLTLRTLLSHTSGVPDHIATPGWRARVSAEPQKVWRPEELLAYVLDAEPLFAVGQGWSYADTNYIVVGMIIERATGRSFYEELTDRILTPLHLRGTSPADRPELTGLVSGYTARGEAFGLPTEVAADGRYAMNPQVEWTGGGLITNAHDLARWAWLLYGGRVLSEESLQRMLEAVPTGDDSGEQYGLGVGIRPSRHGQVLGHSGWVPGYCSAMAYYPDHRLAVAVQVNTDLGVDRFVLATLLDDVAAELADH